MKPKEPARPCPHEGCPRLLKDEETYCPAHAPQRGRLFGFFGYTLLGAVAVLGACVTIPVGLVLGVLKIMASGRDRG